jgi:hypothetical protein
MNNQAYGNLLLYKQKIDLENQNDEYRLLLSNLTLNFDYNRINELNQKIAYNEKQIQEIKDFLRPPIEEVKPKKKKGFYLFGYKIF